MIVIIVMYCKRQEVVSGHTIYEWHLQSIARNGLLIIFRHIAYLWHYELTTRLFVSHTKT